MFVQSSKIVLAIMFLALSASDASAELLGSLKYIQHYAESFCGGDENLAQTAAGKTSRAELSATAKAELGELVKLIGKVDASVSAKYGVETYRGLLQSDLAKELASRRECRFKVFDRLTRFVNINFTRELRFTTRMTANYIGTDNFRPVNEHACGSNVERWNSIGVCITNLDGSTERPNYAMRLFPGAELPVDISIRDGDSIQVRTYTCPIISIDELKLTIERENQTLPNIGYRGQPFRSDKFRCLGAKRENKCYVTFKMSSVCKIAE